MAYNRFRFVLITVIIAAIISGCGARTDSSASGRTGSSLVIVTSFYPMYIETINITRGIQGVKVINLAKPKTGCLHDYALTPNDIKTLEKARIFVINGAGMEGFLDKVSRQLPDLALVNASENIELLKETSPGAESEYNPHVWLSIPRAILQVKNISRQLAGKNPQNAEKYSQNAEVYIKKLEALDKEMHQVLDTVSSRDMVTFHEAFDYFADSYNLHIAAVMEKEPGTEPSARELAEIVDIVNNKKIHALFVEPQYSAKAALTIARETGAAVYTLDPVVTGVANGNYDAYLNIMKKNLKVLKEALND